MSDDGEDNGGNDDGGGAGFRLQAKFDSRELLGARWWQPQLQPVPGFGAASSDVTRRAALQRFLLIGGAAAFGGIVLLQATQCSGSSGTSGPVSTRALDLQRRRGWAVDATSSPLAYPDAVADNLDVAGRRVTADSLLGLADRLRPAPALRPFYAATLFQALDGPDRALRQGLRPICSPAMRQAFAGGEAIGELFVGVGVPKDAAIVADLPGAEAVAFAAGARQAFATVCTFDNWPHPRGVVPAHLALAAAAYYEPMLLTTSASPPRPPVFVLDRARLLPYRDEPDRFDNRYMVRLPDADGLRVLGIARVLYVVPAGVTTEMDDLNAAFAAWREAGIEVRLLSLAQFAPNPAAPAPPPSPSAQPVVVRHYYFGSPFGSWWFWNHYPWYAGPRGVAPSPAPLPPAGAGFVPSRRSTMFSRGTPPVGFVRTPSEPSSGGGSFGRSGGYGYSG
jgi:hypothetical protein